MRIAGIDEAGRGPVLGNLVMAIVACEDEELLRKMGVKDSKLLTPVQREKLAIKLREFPHEIVMLTPAEIDKAVEGSDDNLNKLEARTTALLIAKLAKRVPLSKVVIDSPQKSVDVYERFVRIALDKLDEEGVLKRVALQCEIKADLNHPVVGAASILAKVTRDAAIRALEAKHGPLGSGYMTDPLTQEFLSRNWQAGHDFFRKSWESYRRLTEKHQPTLSDFEEKSEEHAKVVKAFEALKEHGFEFQEPTNPYEVVRMRKGRTTIIRYTTGKVVAQGQGRDDALKLLEELSLA